MRSYCIFLALVGALWGGTSGTAGAATCRAERAGVEVVLELVDSTPQRWAPWCAKLADFLQLRPPLAAATAGEVQKRLGSLDYFSEVSCRTSTTQLTCRMHPEVMITKAEVKGKLPLALLREDVRRRVFLRSGTLMPKPAEAIAQQEERLVKYLVSEGFLDAKVHIDLVPEDLVVPNLGVALVAHVDIGPAFSVDAVKITGSVVMSDARVRRRFTPDVIFGLGRGRFRPPLLVEEARALEEALQAQGYVSARVRARAERLPGQARVQVHVDIHAGPLVVLHFTGDRPMSTRALKAATTFRSAGAIDGLEIESSRLSVLRTLQEKGYDRAQVTVQEERQRGPVRVTFDIHAGARRWLDEVRVVLPPIVQERVGEAAVRAKLGVRASFLLAETWVDEVAKNDCDAIVALLREKGFPTASARAHVEAHPELIDRVIGRFEVEAPTHDVVEGVTLVGLPAKVAQAPLMAGLECQDGGPFVPGMPERDVGRLQAGLVGRGYLDAEVTAHEHTEGTPTGSRTEVTFHITPGVLSVYTNLLVRGRIKTKLDVIEDEIRLSPGDTLTSAAITQTKRRLLSFNIFSNLNFVPLKAHRDNPNTELLVAVQERDDRTLDGLVTFSTDDYFAVGVSYNDRNLWGRAVNFTVDGRFANAEDFRYVPVRIGNVDRIDLKLNTFHPFGAPFDVEVGTNAAYMDYATFRYTRVGGSVALVRALLDRSACRFCPQVTGRLAYELSDASLNPKDDSAHRGGPQPTVAQTAAATVGRLAPSVTADRRDSALDPHSGYFLSTRLEWANPAMAGPLYEDAGDFWRVLQRAQGFYPIIGGPGGADSAPTSFWGGPLILAAAAEWDAAGFFGDRGNLPPSESFAYGGDNSVRGLNPRGAQVLLGDNVRGRFMMYASMELRWYLYRIGIGTIQLAGFLDYGSVSADLGGLFAQNTLSIGPALRYVTQVGPLTLAYGRILTAPDRLRNDPTSAPQPGRWHFMFGYSF